MACIMLQHTHNKGGYMKTIILTVMLISSTASANERIATIYKEIFGKTPTISTAKQCIELKTEISARQGGLVVIPACVALGLDQYTN